MKPRILFFVLLLTMLEGLGNSQTRNHIDFILTKHVSDRNIHDATNTIQDYHITEYKIVTILLTQLYKKIISSQNISACIFSQSCSNYSQEAIRRHGIILGLLMTSDRLQRCHSRGLIYYQIDPKTKKAIDGWADALNYGTSVKVMHDN